MSSTAIAALHSAFTDSFTALGQDQGHDRKVVVTSWPSVPVEVIRAAGFNPVFAGSSTRETPAADQVLEAGIFPNRIRQLLQAALTGRLEQVAAIVLPRTSDADYKAYLYLQELRRRGQVGLLPPVWLFDLLQSRGPDVVPYDSERVRDLLARLAALHGVHVADDDVRAQIAAGNAARTAARRLAALRSDPPRVAGAAMLPLLGARWSLPPERYVALADEAREVLAGRAALAGPRVLLAGTPADSTALHLAIESLQATVVDEMSPYGRDGTAGDIDTTADPFTALAGWYGTHSMTARSPVAMLMRRFEDSLAGIDAAFIVLPADDARFGWDYPRQRQLLAARGIVHAVVSGDPAIDRERIGAVLSRSPGIQAVRHG
jgi:beta-phosphoglucomutase-like phosphatase (HAD superfamily)